MKRITAYMALVAMVLSCNLRDYDEIPLPADKAGNIAIEISEVNDDSFVLSLTPDSECSYYSYMVKEGASYEPVDSSSLYAVKLGGVAKGTIKWTEDAKSATLTIDGLKPNTPYQVYAVAGSKMGFVGKVFNKAVTTTDNVAPKISTYSAKENVLTLNFSEAVKRSEGRIVVKYYARYSAEVKNEKEMGTVEDSDIQVSVDGKAATVNIGGLPSGSIFTLSLEEGAFVDYAGLKSAALVSAVKYNASNGNITAKSGIAKAKSAAPFNLKPLEAEYTKYSTDTKLYIDWGSAYPYAARNSKATGLAVYTLGNKTVSITLAAGTDFGYDSAAKKFFIKLPELGESGNTVDLTISANAFYDIYGNGNAEWHGRTVRE